jgi:hypothetical protein
MEPHAREPRAAPYTRPAAGTVNVKRGRSHGQHQLQSADAEFAVPFVKNRMAARPALGTRQARAGQHGMRTVKLGLIILTLNKPNCGLRYDQ